MAQPSISVMRRTCLLCNTYRISRPDSNERRLQVISELNELVYFYNQQYNELRRNDAPVSEINRAKSNKTLFLDAMTECKGCNRDIDRVNRRLVPFRQ